MLLRSPQTPLAAISESMGLPKVGAFGL